MPDAAIAEPPVEVKTTAPAPHPGAVTIDLKNLGNKPQPVQKQETPAEEAPKMEETQKTEQTPPSEVKKGDKEENMANLRKAREAAEAAKKAAEDQLAALRTEFETFKTKAPELPEDVKGKLTKAEELEKQMEEMRQRVRQTDLARDPDFIEKYNKPIMERLSIMGQTALAAGVPEGEWKEALASWNEAQFAEWHESMNPMQKIKFTAAWTAAVDLHQQQQTELKNADVALRAREKQRQADAENQQKQYFTQNEQLAKSVMAETIKPETLKEYEDLGPAAERLLLQAARHEIPAKDIFQQLAANQVLARVTVKQADRIKELEAALADKDKKITEQDAFIANQAGAVPRGDAAGNSAGEKKGPIWQNLVVKTQG